MIKITNLLRKNKGQAEIVVLLVVALIIAVGFSITKQEKQRKTEELFEKWKQAYEKPDFYGERLAIDCPVEEAFSLTTRAGKLYIIPYAENGKEKVDSSIYSYASFDPSFPNTLIIWLCNQSHIPIEFSYYDDRYYIQSYAGNIYQTEIYMEWKSYGKVINPQDYKLIWIKYPLSVSQIDIKNLLVKLKISSVIVGLQKIPR